VTPPPPCPHLHALTEWLGSFWLHREAARERGGGKGCGGDGEGEREIGHLDLKSVLNKEGGGGGRGEGEHKGGLSRSRGGGELGGGGGRGGAWVVVKRVVECLLEAGVDAGVCDGRLRTPLQVK
jgi:hypothetical protein